MIFKSYRDCNAYLSRKTEKRKKRKKKIKSKKKRKKNLSLGLVDLKSICTPTISKNNQK